MRPFFRLLIAVVFGFCAGGCAMQPPYGPNGGYGAAPALEGYAGQYAQPAQSEPLTAAQAAQLAADAMASEGGYAINIVRNFTGRGRGGVASSRRLGGAQGVARPTAARPGRSRRRWRRGGPAGQKISRTA